MSEARNGYRAYIDDQHYNRDTRLVIVLDRGERVDVLGPDGTWTSYDASVAPVEPYGITMPRAAAEALCDAFAAWGGERTNHETEARVLREWLAIERSRVDTIVAPFLGHTCD